MTNSVSPPLRRLIAACFLISSTAGFQTAVHAQQVMWGIGGPASPSGNLDGALSHFANGNSAGQVKAAEAGILFGSSITVNTIGVQNILSVTGSNNNITSSQDGINSGSVSNSGQIGSGR